LSWLDLNQDGTLTSPELEEALAQPSVQRKVNMTICKFPTEWDGSDVEIRWRWLQKAGPGNPEPNSDSAFKLFCQYVRTQTFWESADIAIGRHSWHFHPREFIRQFRKCGWLSLD